MHNTNFPPNTNPHTFSLIAVAVGFACIGDYNANEQNSIGNWLILVGQYILTHAAQQQLIESRIENGGPFTDNEQKKSNQNQRCEVEFLIDAIKKIQDELNNLK